ncbi:hypothetical protein IP70_16490 [alpha proteobacterium AAP38]|nr:hypothetical protein IP70_16490 [alpha proteobacterium AAP38]
MHMDIDVMSEEQIDALLEDKITLEILTEEQSASLMKRLNDRIAKAELMLLQSKLETQGMQLELQELQAVDSKLSAETRTAEAYDFLEKVKAEKEHAESIKVNATALLNALMNAQQVPNLVQPKEYPKDGDKPVSFHFAAFMKDRAKGDFARTTRLSFEKALATLSEVLGEKPISDVTRQDVAGILGKLDGQAGKHGRTDLKRGTVQKYLSHTKTFFAWAEGQGLVKENPAEKVTAPLESRKASSNVARLPYSPAQLKKVFAAPLFTGCKSEKFVFEPGTAKVRDGRFWIPILGLYTGLRLGELEQLRPNDVVKHEGHWCIDVNEQDTKTTKTDGSVRLVPVHGELMRLGFLDYVKQRKSQKTLFEVRDYSKFWNDRFLNIHGLKTEKLVFHSFRHTFSSWIRTLPNSEVKNRLMGHAPTTTGEMYGRILTAAEIQMFLNLEPVFDLSALYPLKG